MRASVVVLTYNQLKEGTVPCVESIFKFTNADDIELVLVDNASTDGTSDYLRTVEKEHGNVKVVLNESNKGYAGGNNDGLRAATGDRIVLLNNDTLMTPGWLDALLTPLERDRSIGLMCPVTNSAGNEQMIMLPSLNEENYVEVAGRYTAKNKGHLFDTEKLGFYCVAMRRDVLDKVGLLDEEFSIGMFEDDDYCLRVKKAGYRLVINEGCFIYHKGSLSFKKLVEKDYQALFERNRERYEKKHGQPWRFNDLTLAYYNQMRREVEALLQKDPGSPEVERITVRLKGFEYLINQARELEGKGGKGNAMRKERRFSRGFRMFRDEYLKGDKRSRLLFKRKVRRKLRPLKNQEVIDRLGQVRRKEDFKHLVIFSDCGDYHSKPPEATVAEALSAAGQSVIYGTMNREKDTVEVVYQVKEHLYLMNQELFGFLPHLVTPEESVLFVSSMRSVQELKAARLIVDLTGGREGELLSLSGRLSTFDAKVLFLVEGEWRKGVILPRSQTVLSIPTGTKDIQGIVSWLNG
ncbi:MAG: glycosyltransferase family 2 protein [Methanomassiliicoccales archaeon]|nr:glycosyltransferase family 2 protein [Methanomassiliicoccales archaeon]